MRSSSYFKTINLILICLLSSNGCAVYVASVGTPGDLSSVSSSFPLGENREDAEDVLGSPDKKCPRTSNEEQIIYYYFDEGIPPVSEQRVGYIDPQGVLGYVACEILTFGICGVVIGSAMMYWDGPNGLMTIVYDKNDIVVKYRKYSRNELAYSYGPKGYKRGILDCVDIEGEPYSVPIEEDSSDETIKSPPKTEVPCVWQFDSCMQWAGTPQQEDLCHEEKQVCLQVFAPCDTNYSSCLSKVGRAISSESYCVKEKQKCFTNNGVWSGLK